MMQPLRPGFLRMRHFRETLKPPPWNPESREKQSTPELASAGEWPHVSLRP